VKPARRLEMGSSLAWTAVFLTTVLLPLMQLVMDGSRLLYIRGRLQTATDAACEAAAWTAGDRPKYTESGETLFNNDGEIVDVAQYTFALTLDERTRMSFTASLSVTLDPSNCQILCSANALVPVLINVAGAAPQVNVPASAIASIRFR
jgi:hypothetical protein